MAIRTRCVFVGIAPEGAGIDSDDRRLSDPRLRGGCINENMTKVARTEPAQGMIVSAIVIDACSEAGQVAAYKIEFNMKKRSSGCSGTHRNGSACKFQRFRHTVGKEAEASECA